MITVSSKDLDKIFSLEFKTYSEYLHTMEFGGIQIR